MLTGTVVAAIAGEARAVGRSMRAPEASASASTRFIVRPPSGADAARFLGCRCRAMAKWWKATPAHRGWSTGVQRKLQPGESSLLRHELVWWSRAPIGAWGVGGDSRGRVVRTGVPRRASGDPSFRVFAEAAR